MSDVITVCLTTADRSALLQSSTLFFSSQVVEGPRIMVDPRQRCQPIEGFGFSLTGGSAMLISRLPERERLNLLQELFLPDADGIGVSFLRLSIGASDLSERCFSYDDTPGGGEDFELAWFDLEAGDREVIPLLQEILAINPALKLIATPWSAPAWMKTHHAAIGGKLRVECYAVYAEYLVRYLLEMRERGIVVHAMTPQNEPQNHKNEPSMVMEAHEQADFIKNYLGPALQRAGLHAVELFCWDHNCDAPEYPLSLFADIEARRYLMGSAWHLYAGEIDVLSEVHHQHPEMKLYFTEQWVGSDGDFGGDLLWHGRHVLIGALRNWSRVVMEWNLASDAFCCPHTPGGESRCVGALTVGDTLERNVAYYVIAHAAKFVRPGSWRLAATSSGELPHVAFLSPEGCGILIVLNDREDAQSFQLQCLERRAVITQPPRSLASYVWRMEDVA